MKLILALILAAATDECKTEADFALLLFKDRAEWPILNTMPKDQRILKLIQMHKGTGEELWAMVYADCKGLRT